MKTMKSGVMLLLAFLLVFSTFSGTADASKGKKDSKNGEVTKVEFIEELVKTLNVDLQSTEDLPFTDVAAEDAPYVEAAYRIGLVDGVTATEFGPNEKVTREQAYVFLIRSLNLRDEYSTKELNKFKDHRSFSQEFQSELAAAAEFDLMIKDQKREANVDKVLTEKEMEQLFKKYKKEFTFMPIVHTNDLHGRILHNADNGELGLAKVSTIVDKVRKENKNTLLFDLGDTFHGTSIVNLTQGKPAIEALNEMEYDALVPGNHDFNFGNEYLAEIAEEELNFPVISSNILKNGEDFLDGYTIIKKQGKKIGVIGVTATETAVKTSPKNIEGIQFTDEVAAVQETVNELKGKVDHIIVLSHSGLDIDEDIADHVKGVDLVLGGHSHDTIETPEKYTHAYVTQAFEYGKAVGHTNLVFHKRDLIGVNGFLYRDSEDKTEDPAVTNILSVYQQQVEEALSEVIGSTPVKLDGARELVRTQETNLGNLITDAMRSTLGTDIAITNGGGIRASIDAGDVTRGDVETVLPFVNTLVQMSVDGATIKAALEQSVSVAPNQNGGFLHVSGITFTYSTSAPVGSRVQEVFVGGQPLDPNATYTVATNDFTASGGDGYTMFNTGLVEFDSGELLSSILIEALNSGQPIPEVEGRIVQVN